MLSTLLKAGVKTVLDLGCGNGSATARLRAEGYEVAGCDSSASALAFAQSAHPHLEFFQYDIDHPLPAHHRRSYDAVISLEVVEHLLQPRHLIETAMAALYPGGLLILSTPFHGYWKNLALALANGFDQHWHPLRDFGHIKFFSPKTLTALVRETGFAIEDCLRLGRVPPFACSMMVVAVKPQ
jgi:2-polyprenyl-3-methyl-5-hydroxy-6-metoxy-1,4-benzoquinol methylase